jgi:hypothetical protein
MQPDVWENEGADWPQSPFTGKPGINVDLEDPSNPLEYFELFCTPDTAEVIARKNKPVCPKIKENKHTWSEIKI